METFLRVRIDGREAINESRDLNRNLDSLGRAGDRAERAMKFLGRAVGALAFGAVARGVVTTISSFEKLKGQLQTVTGDADLAAQAFSALQDFAQSTPFALEQSVEAFIKMRNLGLQPTERALTSFADTSAALGKDLNQFIEAVADASTSEFERLKEFGIKAKQQGDEVSLTFQGITTTIGNNAEEIVGYLTEIGEVNFADAAANQMERLPGLLANIGDAIRGIVFDTGENGLTGFLEDLATTTLTGLNTLRVFIQNDLAGVLDFLGAKFSLTFSGLQQLVGNVTQAFGDLFGFIADFSGAGDDDVFGGLLAAGEAVLDFFLELPTRFVGVMSAISAVSSRTAEALPDAWRLAVSTFSGLFDGIAFAGEKAWLVIQEAAFSALANIDSFLRDQSANIGVIFANIPGLQGVSDAIFAGLGGLNEFEIKAGDVRTRIAELERQYSDSIAGLNQNRDRLRSNLSGVIDALNDEIFAIADETKALVKSKNETVAAARAKITLEKTSDSLKLSLDEVLKAIGGVGDETGDTAGEIDKLAKAFESLEDRLDPLGALQKDYTEDLALLQARFDAGKISGDRFKDLLAALKQEYADNVKAAQDLTDEADPFSIAWQGALERVDGLFADVWSGAFDSFSTFKDRLLDAFQRLLGELANAAITRPILINLGLAGGIAGQGGGLTSLLGGGGLGAAASVLGPLGLVAAGGATGGAGGLALGALGGGLFGASAIGGGLIAGGLGAATGGALGGASLLSALGGFAVPVVGALLGAAVSAIVSSLGGDNPDPRIRLVNNQVLGTQFETEFTRESPFTANGVNLAIQGQRITETFGRQNSQAFLDAVQQFDQSIAGLLDASQRESVGRALLGPGGESFTEFTGDISVDEALERRFDTILDGLDPAIRTFIDRVGGSFEDRLNSFEAAINLSNVVAASDVFGSLGEALDFIANIPGDPTEVINSVLNLVQAIQNDLGVLREFTSSDLGTAYADAVELAGRTLRQQADFLAEGILELASGDVDVNTISQITQAVQSRYQLELQFLDQLQGTLNSLNGTFDTAIDRIRATQQTEEERYDSLTTEAERLANDVLPNLTDPDRILAVGREIERLTSEAFGLLSPDQQAINADGTIAFLDGVRDIYQSSISDITDAFLSDSEVFRNDLDLLLDQLPEPLVLAADALTGSSADLSDAAASIVAANGGAPGDPASPVGGTRDAQKDLVRVGREMTRALNEANQVIAMNAAAMNNIASRGATAFVKGRRINGR